MRAFNTFAAVAAAAIVTGFAAPAFAAHDLPPADFSSPIATPLSNIGVLLADTGLQNVAMTVGGVTLDATFRSAVYTDSGNANRLNFLYQVTNNSNSNTSVDQLTFASFTGFTITGVWQQTAAFGVFGAGVEGHSSMSRSADGQVVRASYTIPSIPPSLSDVNFGVNGLLNPGETSSILQVQVVADAWRPGTFTAQDGIAVTAVGFAPVVPEPGTWALMILGFGSAGAMLRRRRAASPVVA